MSIQIIQDIAIPNKYTKWYIGICQNAVSRIDDQPTYYEIHHILPKSLRLGGGKLKENIVKLTLREHYICHWLLCKMFKGTQKRSMIYAFFMMSKQTSKGTSRANIKQSKYYAISKLSRSKLLSEAQRGHPKSQSTKDKMSISAKKRMSNPLNNPMFGTKRPQYVKDALSKTHKGKVMSEESRNKQSITSQGKGWWSNGKTTMKSRECPGQDWVRGRKIKATLHRP